MDPISDLRSRKNLEEYLLDLICTVASPEEVSELVNALMVLQQQYPVNELAKAGAGRA
ncbi:MAG: hypothetical protein ACRD59_02665 [Candidatus Acidiferrales bacterium]